MKRSDYLKELYPQTGYLRRGELSARLSDMLEQPLVYVAAGPGYGKTTLVASVVSRMKHALIWISLSPLDNDITFFWKSFMHAAAKELPDIYALMERHEFPDTLRKASSFISELTASGVQISDGNKIVLVLDNLELITNHEILDFVYYLQSINLMATDLRLHLVLIADKQIPMIPSAPSPLAYTNLNMYQALTAKDLAFSKAEVTELMQIHGRIPDAEAADTLMRDTEGWPYLVYSTLTLTPENLSLAYGKIYNLFHRLYFSTYDDDTRQLLTRLAVFSSFNLEIILRLAGKEDGQDRIVGILHGIPFVDYTFSKMTYRMRRPYQVYLRTMFQALPEQIRIDTLDIAGDYLFTHTDMGDIIDFYMGIDNYDAIRRCMIILARHTPPASYVRKILATLATIPAAYQKEHLWVEFFLALGYYKSDQPRRAKAAFAALLDKFSKDEKQYRTYIGESILILALISLIENERFDLALLQKAAAYLPDGSMIVDGSTLAIGENTCFFLPKDGHSDTDEMIGYMKTFVRLFTAAASGCLSGLDYLFEAEANFYRGNTARAEYCAAQAVFKASLEEQHDIALNACHLLVRLALSEGDYEGVVKYKKGLEKYFEKNPLASLLDLMDIFDGFDDYHLGNAEAMADWIRSGNLNRYREKTLSRGRNILISAAYALMRKDYSRYHALVDELSLVLTQHGLWDLKVNVNLHYAISYYHQNQPEQMMRAFFAAYEMIHDNNLYYTIPEFGRPILPVLKAVIKDPGPDIDVDWVRMVEAHTQVYIRNTDRVAQALRKDEKSVSTSVSTLTLTKREKQVLSLLSQGLSRAEIAANLDISISGVQKFLSNIYLKLGARNRADAVSIAHAKNLIL